MKCPELYTIVQQNIRQPILDQYDTVKGESSILVEVQAFQECHKENCAAWDKTNQKCGKEGG